jgi:hypothetical protein
MFAPVRYLLTHRATGPVASLAALFLAFALGASLLSAAQTRAQMEGRIAMLSTQARSLDAYWRARAVACENVPNTFTEGAAPPLARRNDAAVAGTAAELANRSPEGVDACARMESADAAVLSTLK